ncbi:MAG: hypothetical protein ABI181_15330 [Mycobacteriaceae bacterium]
MSSLSPDQARRQLDEADQRSTLAPTDTAVGATFTGGVAVLVALTLAVVTLWRDSALGLIIGMGVFAVMLALLLGWHARTVRVAPRGWGRRYLLGFGSTMVLYTVGIFWEAFAFPGWGIFAPYCVLVAIPGLVAAVQMRRA